MVAYFAVSVNPKFCQQNYTNLYNFLTIAREKLSLVKNVFIVYDQGKAGGEFLNYLFSLCKTDIYWAHEANYNTLSLKSICVSEN